MNPQPDYEALYKALFHEVRSITSRLVEHAATLSKSLEAGPDLHQASFSSEAVAELSFQLQNWLQLSELESGSAIYASGMKAARSLHGAFYRAGKMMRISMKEKRLKWILKTHTKEKDPYILSGYPILETLPYLLLDNAIKYSVPDSAINCYFGRVGDHISIRMTSRGPMLEDGEEDLILESGYRGSKARDAYPNGSGRGLALALMICRLHMATLKISSNPEGYSVSGVEHGQFCVELLF